MRLYSCEQERKRETEDPFSENQYARPKNQILIFIIIFFLFVLPSHSLSLSLSAPTSRFLAPFLGLLMLYALTFFFSIRFSESAAATLPKRVMYARVRSMWGGGSAPAKLVWQPRQRCSYATTTTTTRPTDSSLHARTARILCTCKYKLVHSLRKQRKEFPECSRTCSARSVYNNTELTVMNFRRVDE
jgi:hypothetical protein